MSGAEVLAKMHAPNAPGPGGYPPRGAQTQSFARGRGAAGAGRAAGGQRVEHGTGVLTESARYSPGAFAFYGRRA